MINRTLSGNPPSALSNRRPETTRTIPILCLLLISLLLVADHAEAKRKQIHRPQPDLKILSVNTTPASYSPQTGRLDFAIEVELPKNLDGATILEVSSLISSPSRRSMRFLSSRQPIGAQGQSPAQSIVSPAGTGKSEPPVKPLVEVTLIWDGKDQSEQLVEQGKYSYEVRAKLLAAGEKGLRTQMVSWPKRGTVEVK